MIRTNRNKKQNKKTSNRISKPNFKPKIYHKNPKIKNIFKSHQNLKTNLLLK
jgi:hypothetical protein